MAYITASPVYAPPSVAGLLLCEESVTSFSVTGCYKTRRITIDGEILTPTEKYCQGQFDWGYVDSLKVLAICLLIKLYGDETFALKYYHLFYFLYLKDIGCNDFEIKISKHKFEKSIGARL